MADVPQKFEFTLAGQNKQFTVITGGLTEFHLKRIPVHVLEMENVHRFTKKQLNYYLPKSPKDFRDIYTTGDPAYFERKVSTESLYLSISIFDKSARKCNVNIE